MLEHILNRIKDLNDRYRIESVEDLFKQLVSPTTNWETHQDLYVYTEAFYHSAWRVRELLSQQTHPFQGISGVAAHGVRDVRNQILMHPEQHSNPWIDWSWGYGGAEGPHLRGQAVVGETGQYQDRGLFVNASEFAAELERTIECGIQYLEAPGASR